MYVTYEKSLVVRALAGNILILFNFWNGLIATQILKSINTARGLIQIRVKLTTQLRCVLKRQRC